MDVAELQRLLNGRDGSPVWFFNRDEMEGSQYYPIESVEFRLNDKGVMGFVLTGSPEGVEQK